MNSIPSELFFVKYLLFFRYLALSSIYCFMQLDSFVFQWKTLFFQRWKIRITSALWLYFLAHDTDQKPAEDEGFEFPLLCPLVAKRPHLVSLSSDQFSKCTVCTIWYVLWKRLKGKNKGKLWERYVPPSPTTNSRCREIRRKFRRIFLCPEASEISRTVRLLLLKQ